MRKLRVRACIVDIDGTITGDRATPQIAPQWLLSNSLFEVIREVMVERGWKKEKAARAIVALADRLVFWDYPDFVAEFDLPPGLVWRRLTAWHTRHLVVFADAVAMIRKLKRKGLKLYVASNNPQVGCLLKLQRAGLGDLSGTPWFDRIFCSNILRGQKGSVDWWRHLQAHLPHGPADVVIIGDHDKEDRLVPAQAGFSQFIIVNRRQVESVREADGARYVNDLKHAVQLVGSHD